MERLRFILALVTVLLLSSCAGRIREIEVTSVRLVSVAPMGTTGLSLLVEVGIHNPAMPFEISDMHAVVRYDGSDMLFLDSDHLVVDGHSDSTYMLPLKGTLADGFNPFRLLGLLKGDTDLSRITASGNARVSLRGGPGKVIELNDIPLTDVLEDLTVSE